MQGIPAFVPAISLRPARKPFQINRSNSSPCCSSSRPPSRRRFLHNIAGATTTILLSSIAPEAIRAQAEAEVAQPPAQAKPRGKPRKAAWGYTDEDGPLKWGSLSEEWTICDAGEEQSPIALSYREASTSADASRPKLTTTPGKIAVRVREVNPWAANKSIIIEPYIPPPPPLVGDAPPVDVYKPPPPLAVVTLPDASTYVFRSCHFHVGGSEHVIDGNRGVMEAHFIFEKSSRSQPQAKPRASTEQPTTETNSPSSSSVASDAILPAAAADTSPTPHTVAIAVIGASAKTSAPWLQDLFENFPLQGPNAESRPSTVVMDTDFGEIFPDLRRANFYTYNGSLTTPPGTQGVYWLVLGDRMNTADRDLLALIGVQNGPNVRPLQPRNGRPVTRFPVASDPAQ